MNLEPLGGGQWGGGGGKTLGEGFPVAAFSWTLRVGVTGEGGGFLPHCSRLHCFL